MAKFARYELGKTQPLEIYEGNFMQCDGFYVKIFAGEEPSEFDPLPPRLLCAIRLPGGQRIAEIGIATNPEVPNIVPQAPPDIRPQEPPPRSRRRSSGNVQQKKSAPKVAPLPKKCE